MKNNYIGLNDVEIKDNQKKYGLNELNKEKKDNVFIVYIKQFNDWLVIILILAALLSLIVDPHSLFESFIILLILFVNAFIGAVQEIKSAKTLEGLKKLTNHQTKVIRNNNIVLIEPKYLTIDDIVIIEKGIMVDADMVVLESTSLQIDESLLTGESLLVNKNIGENMYSGTFVVNGSGIGKVIKIGMNSKIGSIASELISIKEEITPLEDKLSQIGKIIGLIAILICICVFLIELLLKISLIEAFKSAVALAVAAIPEGLATVVTVCLAIGVKRMANQNAIIKKLASVETLGCSSIICTDKTGTLTENKQKVVNIYIDKLYDSNSFGNIDKKYLDMLYVTSKLDSDELIDPIDIAIINMLEKLNYNNASYKIEKLKPFNSTDKYLSCNYISNGKEYFIYKGAFDRLSNMVKNKLSNDMLKASDSMMEKGYRVIGLANKEEVLCIIGMQDTIRKDIVTTINQAKTAGLRTIMITGDHSKTAYSIACEVNIVREAKEVITKEELDLMSEEQLEKNIDKYSVFSRVDPLDKVKIIRAWQKRNKIVAMVGDGINDSIALKKADIGCVMGDGAEISKSSADIILTDSNYNTLIKAVKNGRGIYENIKKCVKYLLSSNIGEVLVIFLVLLISLITNINLGVPLLSIHLLWINLITDSLPAFGLGLMNPSDDLMKVPPRNHEENFFDKKMVTEILFMGVTIGLLSVIAYFIGLRIDSPYASTMAFFTLSTSQLIHSYNCSTERSVFNKKTLQNKFLNYSFIIGIVLQVVVLYISGLNTLFKLKPLPLNLLSISVLLSLLILIISEFRKKIENNKK